MRLTHQHQENQEKLVRVTAWVPQKKMKLLMKGKGKKVNQSQLFRILIDSELERVQSLRLHESLYGVAKPTDFDDRLF